MPPENAYRTDESTRSDRIFAPAGSPRTGIHVSPRSVLYTGVTSVSLGVQKILDPLALIATVPPWPSPGTPSTRAAFFQVLPRSVETPTWPFSLP